MIIKINHSTSDHETYRSQRVKSLFNAESGHTWTREFNIDIDNEDWQIGLVVGPSGSGKTSIGKQIFGGDNIVDLYAGWNNTKPIIDCILPEGDFDKVTGALASVGLGDVPSWLRSFNALSNGQQFRAGLARLVAEAPDKIVVDEFTSVVDRQIAKIGAMAFGKNWRRNSGKKIVLLACHYDIIEWLQPDWVFDTATGDLKKKAQLRLAQKSKYKYTKLTVSGGRFLKSITI